MEVTKETTGASGRATATVALCLGGGNAIADGGVDDGGRRRDRPARDPRRDDLEYRLRVEHRWRSAVATGDLDATLGGSLYDAARYEGLRPLHEVGEWEAGVVESLLVARDGEGGPPYVFGYCGGVPHYTPLDPEDRS